MMNMTSFLFGAIAMASAIVALVFLRYFSRTRDPFFLLFAIAFGMEALGNVLSVTSDGFADQTTARYLLRLFQYILILCAIAHKNFSRR
jgi:Family of unknown function (DUF5985)